jgi:hypothetical protein
MSKNMQITVTIRPFYIKDFEGTYPKLGRALRYVDSDFINQNPSLYELTGQIDKLLYRIDGTSIREILIQHKDELKKIYNTIQESIANWNLSETDKLLYCIEDIFEKIEFELE